jgi:NADH-quinone oxidoreductase subunit G
MDKYGVKGSFKDFEKISSQFKVTFLAAPENQEVYDIAKVSEVLKKAGEVICLTACKSEKYNAFKWQIPMKSFLEKPGTYVNYKGIEQKIKAGLIIIKEAISLGEVAQALQENLEARL